MISKGDIEHKRLDLDFEALRIAVELFNDADTDAKRHLFWGSVLKYFRCSVNDLLRLADSDPSTRGVASKIRSQKDKDKVLKYLLSSRNTDEHAAEKGGILAAESIPGSVSVPGLVRVSYNQHSNGPYIAINGCTVGDQVIDGSFYFRDGKPIFSHSGNFPFLLSEPRFELNASVSKKGKTIPVPIGECGDEMTAFELSDYALNWLVSKLATIEENKTIVGKSAWQA